MARRLPTQPFRDARYVCGDGDLLRLRQYGAAAAGCKPAIGRWIQGGRGENRAAEGTSANPPAWEDNGVATDWRPLLRLPGRHQEPNLCRHGKGIRSVPTPPAERRGQAGPPGRGRAGVRREG